MEIEQSYAPQFNSFNMEDEKESPPHGDQEMAQEDGSLFSMEVDSDNYHHAFQQHFNRNGFN